MKKQHILETVSDTGKKKIVAKSSSSKTLFIKAYRAKCETIIREERSK